MGLQAEDPTIAELLKPLGYATGQFGKNHLGDRNEFLPTVHGFDEFFGNLYHLNAEEDPEMPDYPPKKTSRNSRSSFGPRGVLRCWATDKDDPTEQPRWGESASRTSRTPARSPRSAWRPATTSSSPPPRLHQAPARSRQTVLLLGQHHAHALAHAYQAGKPWPSRPLAVALSRHDDRPRQERRASCSTCSTSSASPTTPS